MAADKRGGPIYAIRKKWVPSYRTWTDKLFGGGKWQYEYLGEFVVEGAKLLVVPLDSERKKELEAKANGNR